MHQGNEPLINELTLARSGVFSILNRFCQVKFG